MVGLMSFTIVIFFVFVLAFTFWFIVDWITHINMNTMYKMPYDWVSFKTFMKEFKKYESHPDLEIDNSFNNSIFLYDGLRHIVYLHASIVEFNGCCMILYPLSYLRYCLWKHRFLSCRRKGMWK